MKKLLLVALLVLFTTQNARAEKDGFFVGGSVFPVISMGVTTNEYKHRFWGKSTEQDLIMSLVQLAFGYTHALDERLGLRYYGSFSFGVPLTFNVDFVNVDVLFSVVKGENAELRVFAGGWLGLASYYGGYYSDDMAYNSGLDLGINTGLRLVLGQRHGVEIYGRFGFLSQTKEYSDTRIYSAESWKIRQPYLIGVRYTISF